METYNNHKCPDCKIGTGFDYYDENEKKEPIIQRYCIECGKVFRLIFKP